MSSEFIPDRSPFTAHPSFGLRPLSGGTGPVPGGSRLSSAWLGADGAVRDRTVRQFFTILLEGLEQRDEMVVDASLYPDAVDGRLPDMRAEQPLARTALTPAVIDVLASARPRQITVWLGDAPIFECSTGWLGLTVWLTKQEERRLSGALADTAECARDAISSIQKTWGARTRTLAVKLSEPVLFLACFIPAYIIAERFVDGIVKYFVGFVIMIGLMAVTKGVRAAVDKNA